MARTMPPSPSPHAAVKREIDVAEPSAHTSAPPPRKKRRRGGRLPVAPTQLPLSPPLLTPQTIPLVASGDASLVGLTPTPACSAVKVEPGADAGVGDHRRAAGKPNESRDPRSVSRPAAAEPPTLWLNRRRLGQILHELAGAHRWRDAASVVSTLLSGNRRPDSYEETRRMFVTAMEIHKRLAEDSSVQHGGRSSYYLRTQKLFNVWMRKMIWFPSCPKKNLVTLELALFYLSQGNIDNAHLATRTLIAKSKLQTEPILNLIHGLISFDKWYSGLPKDMQVEDFDVYDESCGISMKSNGSKGTDLLDNSDEDSMDIHESSLATCSSESSINNENIDRKMNNKPGFVHPKEEMDPLESQANENLRSIFLDTSDGPTCGLEQSLLPLKLKIATGASNDCFDKYMKYKSVPNTLYEDAEKCLRLALYSNPPVMAALLPLIQILLLGDKLKDALNELEKACLSSTTALPFRLRGRLLEEYDQNQVSTISSCYEEALRRDPTCSYSMERLIKMHRKGYYNAIQLLEAIALHLDSANGKPCIWEELVSCFLRLFSDNTANYEDCISCTNTHGDEALEVFSKLSSVFFERFTRESWKARCRWWAHHHFSQNAYTSETRSGRRQGGRSGHLACREPAWERNRAPAVFHTGNQARLPRGKESSAGRKSCAGIGHRGIGRERDKKGRRDRERISTVPAGFRFLCTLRHPARLRQFQRGTRGIGAASLRAQASHTYGFVNSSVGQEGLGETRRSPVLHGAQLAPACFSTMASSDPGWKYAHWPNLPNKDVVTCTLCGHSFYGGIKRLKQHLAGGFGDTKICTMTTTAIRKEMRDDLETRRRRRLAALDDID